MEHYSGVEHGDKHEIILKDERYLTEDIITDSSGVESRVKFFRHDEVSRKVFVHHGSPQSQPITYTFDINGNMIKEVDTLGNFKIYERNNFGKIEGSVPFFVISKDAFDDNSARFVKPIFDYFDISDRSFKVVSFYDDSSQEEKYRKNFEDAEAVAEIIFIPYRYFPDYLH